MAQRGPGSRPKRHQGVEQFGAAGGGNLFGQGGQQALLRAGLEIENSVADGDADPCVLSMAEDSIGKVL